MFRSDANNISGCDGLFVGGCSDGGLRGADTRQYLIANAGGSNAGGSINNHGQINTLVQVDLALSIALSLGAASVSTIAIKRVSKLMNTLNRTVDKFLPAREQQRVRDLLAQLAVLTKSDRVVLGIFFDGAMTSKGYHFEKLAVPICYARPNMPLLPELGKEVPVEDIEREISSLWATPSRQVVITKETAAATDCPDCALYLERRNLEAIRLHLLHRGATELGILGFHFQSGDGSFGDDVLPTTRRIELELTEIVGRSSLPKKK